ncbi:MAG: ATP/GTP-binding protein [Candidatus Ranarchaeia archaeon]
MRLTYVMGTAGSGKTLLTHHLSSYMQTRLKLNLTLVNLDPGVKVNNLPYSPDVDVRDFVDYEQISTQLKLGPNGALIEAANQLSTKVDEIRDEIEYLDSEYVLLDLPGQIELFAYRTYGRALFEVLEPESQVTLFLMEPSLARTPLGFISLSLLGLSLAYRFPMPQLNVLTKSDLLKPEEIDKILNWSTDIDSLITEIETFNDATTRLYGTEIFRIIETLGSTAISPLSLEVNTVPSDANVSLIKLYSVIQQLHQTEEEITGFAGKEDEEERHPDGV